MGSIKMFDIKGNQVKELDVLDDIFAKEAKPEIIHSVLKWQLACRRQGTANALTRAEVRGGGHKPWSQKGTGRARSGSNRSPLWRGGGVIFGPKTRDYSYSISNKVRFLALKMAISDKLKSDKLKVIDKLELKGAKTKNAAKVLKALGIDNGLIVIDDCGADECRSVRNIKNIKIIQSRDLNIFDILKYEWLVLDGKTVINLEAKLK